VKLIHTNSAYETRGGVEIGTNYRGPAIRKRAQGPQFVNVFLVLGSTIICLLYKLTLSHQAQVTMQLTVSLSDLV
jgi:hypothetical protein